MVDVILLFAIFCGWLVSRTSPSNSPPVGVSLASGNLRGSKRKMDSRKKGSDQSSGRKQKLNSFGNSGTNSDNKKGTNTKATREVVDPLPHKPGNQQGVSYPGRFSLKFSRWNPYKFITIVTSARESSDFSHTNDGQYCHIYKFR